MIVKNKTTLKEFVLFNIIGLINTLLTIILYFCLVYIEVHYLIALIIDYIFGIFFSYYMNRKYTFNYKFENKNYMFLKMLASYLLIFFINTVLLYFFIEELFINKYFSQVIAMFILIIIAFHLQKFFVFKKKIK